MTGKEKTIQALKGARCDRCKFWEPPDILRDGIDIGSFCWREVATKGTEDAEYRGPDFYCDYWELKSDE